MILSLFLKIQISSVSQKTGHVQKHIETQRPGCALGLGMPLNSLWTLGLNSKAKL